MKKIFYSLLSGLTFALLFSACEDVNDQFDGLDAQTEITNKAQYNYTLTDADYKAITDAAVKATTDPGAISLAQSINANKYFTAAVPASKYVSYLLKTKYPYGDLGSSALITYAFNEGVPTYLSDFTSATPYTLVTSDYASSGSTILGYYPTANPATYLPAVLAAKITAPAEGKIALASYTQYTETPVITTTTNYLVEENFEYGSAAGDLKVLGASNWVQHSGTTQLGYETTNLSMAGYPSSGKGGSAFIGANSDDLNRSFPEQTSGTVFLSTLINISQVSTSGGYFLHFMDGGFAFPTRVWAKDNGAGKISFGVGHSGLTNWGTTTFDYNTTYLLVASYNITSGTANLYILPSVVNTMPSTPEVTATLATPPVQSVSKIAIRQGGGPTATLDGMRVATSWANLMVNNVVSTVIGNKATKEVYYKYSGSSWTLAQGVYALTTADYDSMGTGAGQPGQFDNFSSSINPENYIPTLLSKLFNYTQNGAKQIVSYKYFSGGVQTRVDEYVFENGKWIKPSTIVQKTEQFVFSNAGWVFDPTVKMTMQTADYQLMVDYVLNTPSIAVFAHPFYKNEEYYYGFASRFTNVNFRLSYRNPYFTGSFIQPVTIDPELNNLTTDAAKVALMYNRLKEGVNKFLQLRYPNAVPTVSGLEVNYHVTLKIYYANGLSSGDELHTYIFKCTSAGTGSTPPSFEFVSSSKI